MLCDITIDFKMSNKAIMGANYQAIFHMGASTICDISQHILIRSLRITDYFIFTYAESPKIFHFIDI
ncbi:hypothetical protein QTP88_009307 [Uroleucon formosanum]